VVRAFKISLVILFGLAYCLAFALPKGTAQKSETSPREGSFDKTVPPFFAKNCYVCHSAKMPSGGLNLQDYNSADHVAQHRNSWETILQRLRTGEMPPKEMPRPDKASLEEVTRLIEEEIAKAEAAAKPDLGRVTARRLNRAEYNNTVRDLLGVDLDPAADFPHDDSAYGFDNIADALSLSPTLMEKYVAAAERLAQVAFFGHELKPSTWRGDPTQPRRMEINPVRIEQPPFYSKTDYDVTGVGHPGAFHLTYRFPVDGDYLFRIRANGARPPGSEPQQMDFRIDGKVVRSFEVPDRVTATNERLPVFMEVRFRMTAGRHELIAAFPRLFEGLPANHGGPNPSKRPVPPPRDPEKFFQPLPANATPEQIAARKAAVERARNRARQPRFDGMAVAEFEIVGPFDYKKGPSFETLGKVYLCGHLDGRHSPGCDRKIVSGLARRAFRRPVAREEVDQLLALTTDARKRGRTFEQGLALALQAILVSPDFLFRIERDRPGEGSEGAFRVNLHELASRLSYFLWSSMPDDELRRCADSGKLRHPKVLAAQVRRMLKDPKSNALIENFGGQWLEVRRLESVRPDRDRFPDFDDYLRSSMQKETELFFQSIVRDDQSILNFLAGKYTFLNERLARHYGIKGVVGPEFRRVEVAGSRRGGVLTQASVLTVSSYANRTSPALRGKWVLENLLNEPPRPPPPNVPSLDEEAVGSKASLRQQMEQHRASPICASCHARMDPLGFSLENYDAVGAWRTKDGLFPIDPAGALPDGSSFKGPEDLKAILSTHRDPFTEALTEKLLTYALGRGVGRDDRPAIRKIAASAAADRYRFSRLVLEVVNSQPFRMRRGHRGQT
jgi:Protein of unknown function (DUF1592)/Protein of unknown function (DUF1588)/Protein of unknown function (DUF1587)/Protein of unknown function (DUF1585)/Protein of unknown function (DUF1595)/Planctomycete cytochrome C